MKRRTYLASLTTGPCLIAGCVGRAENEEGLVFTDRSELSSIAKKARKGTEPWASAWNLVKTRADFALDEPLVAVTDDDNDHRFKLDVNQRHDYRAAIAMGDWARDAALAYFVTGRDEYAKRTIDIIHHWCLHPDTYMRPTGGSGPGGNPEQFITLPRFWYAASLVREHSYWRTKSAKMPWKSGTASDPEAAFRAWVTNWTSNVRNQYDNNIYIWWLVCEGSAHGYLKNKDEFDRIINNYKKVKSWNDYNDCTTDKAGTFERELHRNKPFKYQLWRMRAHLYFCEVARHMGYDLYQYNAPTDSCSGSTLRKSLEAMIPFVRDPNQWDFPGKGVDEGAVSEQLQHSVPAIYELAHSYWGDPRYLEMIDVSSGRPVNDDRILGIITFSHGNLDELNGSLL